MNDCQDKNEIKLSPELQKSIFKFFLKTSMPRKAKKEREKKALSIEQKEQDIN